MPATGAAHFKGAEFSPWTPQRVEDLKKLWADGLSASQIAKELGGGLTRNSVIGKVSRLGLSGRITSPRPRLSTPRVPKPRAVRQHKFQSTPLPAAPDFVPEPEPISIDDQLIPVEQRRTTLTLEARSCRWPVGDPVLDPANFFYCGADRTEGSSYCRHHDRRSKQ